jgi:hypothetical protein
MGFGRVPYQKIYIGRNGESMWYRLAADGKTQVPELELALTGYLTGIRHYKLAAGYKDKEPAVKVAIEIYTGDCTYLVVAGIDSVAGRGMVQNFVHAPIAKNNVYTIAVRPGSDEGGKVVLPELYCNGKTVYPPKESDFDVIDGIRLIAEALKVPFVPLNQQATTISPAPVSSQKTNGTPPAAKAAAAVPIEQAPPMLEGEVVDLAQARNHLKSLIAKRGIANVDVNKKSKAMFDNRSVAALDVYEMIDLILELFLAYPEPEVDDDIPF